MKKLLITLTFNLVFIASKLVAQTPYVAIPDSNFVHYLKTIVPTAFKGDSLNKSSTLVTTTTQSISVSSYSIISLSGIQYFTSLTYLECDYNSITSLPTLPNTLKWLDCNHNQLTSLPTLPTSLTYLDCEANQLTNLPTLPNTLTGLECFGNFITNLPTLPNSLKTLQCAANALTSLPTLPDSLIYMECHVNSLTSLPTLPSKLWYLQCNSNSLTSLPTLPNTISYLLCENNNITCFPNFPNALIDTLQFNIDPNPYNCLPNHITAMGSTDLAVPLCAVGNSNSCPVAVAGIEHVTGLNSQIAIYPNPAKDVLHVKGLAINEETHIQIMDMFGNFVKDFTVSDKVKKEIDIRGLEEGVYNLNITNKEGSINKKLVIVN